MSLFKRASKPIPLRKRELLPAPRKRLLPFDARNPLFERPRPSSFFAH